VVQGPWPGPAIRPAAVAIGSSGKRPASARIAWSRRHQLVEQPGPGLLIASQTSLRSPKARPQGGPGHVGLSQQVGRCQIEGRRGSFFHRISGLLRRPTAARFAFVARRSSWRTRCRDAGVELLGLAREMLAQGRIVAAHCASASNPCRGESSQQLDREAGRRAQSSGLAETQQARGRPGQC